MASSRDVTQQVCPYFDESLEDADEDDDDGVDLGRAGQEHIEEGGDGNGGSKDP